MAFNFIRSRTDGGNFQMNVMLPTKGGEVYTLGEGLVFKAGAATKAGATEIPTHICGNEYNAPATGNKPILCYLVAPLHEYETEFKADGSAINGGDKVTLSADGLGVTATTTGGVATIIKKLGTGASGTRVRVSLGG